MENYKILFVCLGNICRSPAAEGIFKQLVTKYDLEDRLIVDSAGTSAYHSGELPDERMRKHGKLRGYTFDSLSRQFTVQDFGDFNIIIAMDDNNYNDIIKLAPDKHSEKKVQRMVDFGQLHQARQIPDPYYSGTDGFELVLDLLEDACNGLFIYLKTSLS